MTVSPDQIVTRFAPSPTGMLHIGGARTALFNWLLARHHEGRFLLRIEDTDRARSTPEAVAAILDGLSWLGITPDEPPLFQSSRLARHAEIAEHMLEIGQAYRCYCTPDELSAMRERARAAGLPARYDGTWRDRDASQASLNAPSVIRLRAPQQGETVIEDQVQGAVRVANREIDDLVLLRSDQTPTYLLSVVVDDHDSEVTHVIRGDDHLTNAFRQLHIYRALGWAPPAFAHIPLIHGPDGAKLSKRHGAAGIDDFRQQGFLPTALRNYLLRLGWAHGDDEIIEDEQAIAWFTLQGVGRSPARLDWDKLRHVNGWYMHNRLGDSATLAAIVPFLLELTGMASLDEPSRQRIAALLADLRERARTLRELAEQSLFLLARPDPNAKAAAVMARTDPGLMADLRQLLASVRAMGHRDP